jgi:A/G-specific adenine glycosylase
VTQMILAPLELPVTAPEFSGLMLSWYDAGRRSLPWRDQPDLYLVWVSEVMLQQTQVRTVLPYYREFVRRFPDIHSLASASEEQLLSAWSGLGYYSRVRNLRRAARLICERHRGHFPTRYDEVRRLPGIGPYTAGAILSIACNQPWPALDGNVRRLLCRYLAVEAPDRLLTDLLQRLVTHDSVRPRVSDFNQSLMELGALVCTPRSPGCRSCPLSSGCRAREEERQDDFPRPKSRKPQEQVLYVAAVIRRQGRHLMTRNAEGALLQGMWDFPKLEGRPEGDIPLLFRQRLGLSVAIDEWLPAVIHQITFRRIHFHPFIGRATGPIPEEFRWVGWEDPSRPVSSHVRKILGAAGQVQRR